MIILNPFVLLGFKQRLGTHALWSFIWDSWLKIVMSPRLEINLNSVADKKLISNLGLIAILNQLSPLKNIWILFMRSSLNCVWNSISRLRTDTDKMFQNIFNFGILSVIEWIVSVNVSIFDEHILNNRYWRTNALETIYPRYWNVTDSKL